MARFITADTIVPDWTNPQTLNRYSYVINNPLKYVDPTGNWFWMALLIGAAIGGASAAINGGNILQGMLMGAVTGVITGGLFHGAGILAKGMSDFAQAAMHFGAGAISGGINAVISGGDIMQGMLIGAFSAGVAKGFNVKSLPGRMAIGALSGGFASELAGGSFGDGAFQGAWTSAMAYVFNDLGKHINRAKMERMARIAQRFADIESELWATDNEMSGIKRGVNKCNIFWADVAELSGAEVPLMVKGKYPANAMMLWDKGVPIENWIPIDKPIPGAVGSDGVHVGIANLEVNGTISVKFGESVGTSNWGFRDGQNMTWRAYTGP